MTNRPEWMAATFGTALSGATAVALSTFSTAPELDYMLKASGVSVLLFEGQVLKKSFVEMLTELQPDLAKAKPGAAESLRYPFLRYVAVVGAAGGGAVETWDGFLARGKNISADLVKERASAVSPADPGLILFSSGSTSRPKGIINSHRAASLQLWRWPHWYKTAGHDDIRCWSANGFFWSGNFGMALGGALSTGGSLVLQTTFDANEALELIQKEKVNLPIAWPHQMAQFETAPNWEKADLSSLRFVDELTPLGRHPTVTHKWREPYAAYGNTETFTISSIFASGTPEDRVAGSSGQVLPGNTFKIVDPLSGETVPMGELGEIAVKGPTLMLGYIGIPLDETLDADGFFRTGDGGYVDETGRLFWKGRLNDIIKTGGANVSPKEIDHAIEQLPGVKMTQTVGVPHDTLGEIVVSCIVPHEGVTLTEEQIRDFLKPKLASYKVPRKVLFFNAGDLNLTGTAKIKTADLRVLAAKRLQES
jgi:fatty-acyl-CoA synthase